MSKATDISKINEHSPYYDMTPGNQIYGGGGSRKFCTGEWRTKTPVIDWEKCKGSRWFFLANYNLS